jgi:protocatechuate 3,4-dioxygenase beta subunit
VIDDDVILYLYTRKDKRLIKEAKLELDSKQIKYDAGYGGYSISKKSINRELLLSNKLMLKVSFEGEIYVFNYSFQDGGKPYVAPNYYNNTYSELNSPGYLITDKPLYKPLDTLNIKSFLINFKNGNPIRKKAHLVISENGQQFSYSTKIKQKTPGAFVYQWKIPDTLKLDRSYQVKLWYKKRGRTLVKNTSFRLEEYELNKNKYELDMPSDVFFAGDDIKFYATAKDMNGFPVQGTRIHFKVRLNDIQELFLDTITISQAKKNTWYEKDTVIEYENFIELKIPSDSLLKANATYSLEVSFVDPMTFEKKAFVKPFLKYTQKEKLLFYQQEDSVHVRNLFNSKDTIKHYFFVTMRGADTITKKKISTPFHYKLNPSETNAIVIDQDSFKTQLAITYNKLEMMHAKGKRTGDSMLISFTYPFNEPIHYRIYKKDKLIKSGESNKLKFAMLDQSADAYRIVMTSNLHNTIENNFYEMKFVPEKNILHFEKKIASTALPGDSLAIEMKVLDYKNQPVKNVNIAAYAINKAFAENIQTPYIHVPANYQNKIEINPIVSRDIVYLKSEVNSGNYQLNNEHFKRFDLRKNEFYQLKYPLNELTEIRIKKQQSHPEYSIVLTVKDNLYTPRYILLDGQPVFVSDLDKMGISSFASTVGKHKLTFRYFDKTYELNNVEFLANTKHVFGTNIDSVKKVASRFAINDSLMMLEPTEQEKKLLYNTFLLTNTFNADSVKIVSNDLNYKKQYAGTYEIPRLNIDGETYFVQGPFTANSNVTMNVNGKTFYLKTGIETVYHYDDVLKEFVPKPLGGIKGAFLHFSENPLQLYALNSLLVPDTIVPLPISAPLKFKPETANALQPKEEESFYQNYLSKKNGEYCQIIIDNKNDTNFVKSMWIISKKNFEACDYIQQVGKQRKQIVRRSLDEPFDVYLFFNKDRMAILKDIKQSKQNEFYINPQFVKNVPFNKDLIIEPLKIYTELNAVPLLPFYDAPFESKERIKQIDKPRNNLYIHGMITDDIQMPLNGALVFVELNGKYKYGAVTNENGLFELLDIMPATYQIKIYHPSYKILHFEPMFFEGNKEYEINSSLPSKELYHPMFEVIQSDFRMMAFVKQEQVDILKLSVHEKETRTQLDNVKATLLYQGQIVGTYTLNRTNFEIPFPKAIQNRLYTIEISKPGYTTLRLNNIEFKSNYTYVIESFLGLEKKELLKQKEFDLNMEFRLPEIEEEVVLKKKGFVKYEKENMNNNPGELTSEIYGRILNQIDQPLDYASVQLFKVGKLIAGAKSNENGEFRIKPIPKGTYSIKVSYLGFKPFELVNLKVESDKSININIVLEKKENNGTKGDILIKEYNKKLIDPADPGKQTMTSEQIRQLSPVSSSDFASTQEGVYQRKAGDNSLNLGGDRLSATSYTVSGGMLSSITTTNVELEKSRQQKPLFADSTLIDQVMANSNASTIRKQFNDVGYWKPNMITNKQGVTAFTVKLPDNITSWKSNFIGVGKKWLHGIDSAETKVYKPLQTICLVPSYLYKNDKLEAKIKYQNLTKNPLKILSKVLINGKEMVSKNVDISNTYMDSIMIEAYQRDTISFEGGLVYKDKYKDFEHYDIPILSSAMKYHSNQSLRMEKDSTYDVRIEPNTKGTIVFNNTLYEKVVEIVDELNRYEYGCVEQTASKLSAVLVKHKIQQKLKIKSSTTKEVNTLMARLADMQNIDGSFGCWRGNGTSDRMTIYCMEVTLDALRNGYQNNVLNACKEYIIQHFSAMSLSDKIYAMNVFINAGYTTTAMMNEYANLNTEFLKTTDKLYYTQNKLALKQDVRKEDLYALFLEMNSNVNKPYFDNFFYDTKADLFKAYSLFKNTTFASEFIDQFKKKLVNGQFEKNLNTYAKAKMIEALMMDAMTDTSKPIQSKLIINDTLNISSFPYRINIAHSTYKIKHKGGDVFLNTSEEHFDEKPAIHDSVFAIATTFKQNGKALNELKSGVSTQYEIDIQSYKSGEHVMVEIPIPSGMKVTSKNSNVGQDAYVEYYKHKIVYYFSKLPMGMKHISIQLMPVFKGDYIVPASKTSLMYYPFVFGNSLNKTISIN